MINYKDKRKNIIKKYKKRISIRWFRESLKEAFNTFVLRDHLIVEKGNNNDFFEVEVFHVVDEEKPD